MGKIHSFCDLKSIHCKGTTVLATGFFDLLHEEHENFLKTAKKHGDMLIVGVESDYRARTLKGQDRPFQTQITRAKNISNLDFVDIVILLPSNFGSQRIREDLIKALKPNILAVSSHTPNIDKKSKLVQKYGGELRIVYDQNPNISTTIISKRLYNR